MPHPHAVLATMLTGGLACGCWSADASTPSATPTTDSPTSIAVDSLTLRNGQQLVGIYHEDTHRLQLLSEKTGKTLGEMEIEPDQITEHHAVTLVVHPEKPSTLGSHADWIQSFAIAQKSAKATGRPILIDFTGSDWCPWCMKLHQEVFETETFKTWAAKNVILMLADFPRNHPQLKALSDQNRHLQEVYAISGYPTVLLLSASGAVLARTGYQPGGAKAWLDNFRRSSTSVP